MRMIDTELADLAFELADETARSDVECASMMFDRGGQMCCDVSDPDSQGLLARALRYMDLRGDALPYRVIREGDILWFEERS